MTTTADRNALFTTNYPLLRWAAARACRMAEGLEFDDALGEIALLGVRRFARFDPARSKFTTWVAWLARAVAGRHTDYALADCRDGRRTWNAPDFARVAAPVADPGHAERAEHARARVAAALDRLPGRVRLVLALRYGLGGGDPLTLDDIGGRLGVSRERVRQLERRGLRQLRTILRDRTPPRATAAVA